MSEVQYVPLNEYHSLDEIPDKHLYHRHRQLLLDERQFPCAAPSCNSTEHLGVFHIANWCGGKWYDYDKLKEFLSFIDPYGFSREMRDEPITSIHDLRNLIVLCKRCHSERPFALTKVPFPQFVMQAVAKKGISFEHPPAA